VVVERLAVDVVAEQKELSNTGTRCRSIVDRQNVVKGRSDGHTSATDTRCPSAAATKPSMSGQPTTARIHDAVLLEHGRARECS
jgi:hypothetical protein